MKQTTIIFKRNFLGYHAGQRTGILGQTDRGEYMVKRLINTHVSDLLILEDKYVGVYFDIVIHEK